MQGLEQDWNRFTPPHLGHHAEYLVALNFGQHGFSAYRGVVDDHGVDLVVTRNHNRYFAVQVKSARLETTRYVFYAKKHFAPHDNLLAALVLFRPEPGRRGLSPAVRRLAFVEAAGKAARRARLRG